MILILGASSIAWLAVTALSAGIVYFALRLHAKRRFYRVHDLVCTESPPTYNRKTFVISQAVSFLR